MPNSIDVLTTKISFRNSVGNVNTVLLLMLILITILTTLTTIEVYARGDGNRQKAEDDS